jgi:hypothetical protein
MIELTATKLPGRLTLKVARSAETLFGALELLEDTRKKLVRTHTKHDENGEQVLTEVEEGSDEKPKPIWLDDDGGETFQRELEEAVQEDAEVIFIPILLKHFPKEVQFTPNEALALEIAGLVKE